jgi:Rps23 Pro-64 3,4-dihydroxylase Tpa1-like proline 4-hydroxylase
MKSILNIKKFEAKKKEFLDEFNTSAPYPHLILDNFLNQDIAEKLLKEHEEQGDAKNWGAYNHVNERKSGITEYDRMGEITKSVINELSSKQFLELLEEVTGIEGLISDPDLDGGGLHMIERGGFLNVHVDFLAHTTRKSWSRQLNLLIYLNKDWRESWGGALELWDKEMTSAVQKITPIFNRCVIFHTCDGSYHGHPIPLDCPANVQRRSLALYYFRDEGSVQPLRPTYYSALPDDSTFKRVLIALDRKALGLYTLGKRYVGMKDGLIQKLMRFF